MQMLQKACLRVFFGALLCVFFGSGHAQVFDRLYPDSLEVQPHKYDARGHYLIVVPRAPADSLYRLIFETDSLGRVRRYRAGLRPAVEYVEGCA